MSDMTMCINIECPRKRECYRFMAIPGHHQPFMDYSWSRPKCEYFVEIKGRKVRDYEAMKE